MLSSKKSLRKLGVCAKALPALLMLLCVACGAGEPVEEVVTGAREKETVSEQAVNPPLPADEAEGWRPSGSPTVFQGESLYEHINGGADIYYEYGFVEVALEYYGNGDKEVSVEIYRMDDAAAAFGSKKKKRSDATWRHYWLWSLERACSSAGVERLGEHDW